MSWTPHYTNEPHAYASVLTGPLPFTPHEENRGRLRGQAFTGSPVALEFEPVLTPTPDACLVESIKHVWLFGRNLTAARVTPPEGWVAVDVHALAGWPGTCVQLVSPPDFQGRSVTLAIGAAAQRAVALMEWRGTPNDITIVVEDDDGHDT